MHGAPQWMPADALWVVGTAYSSRTAMISRVPGMNQILSGFLHEHIV